MSARVQPSDSDSVGLTQLTVADLDPLLAEEIGIWRQQYKWDFRPSADLLRRFLQIQSLYGRALVVSGRVVGYGYYVCEGRKGLIGDFFVSPLHSTRDREMGLLHDILTDMRRNAGVRRIESQLMMLQNTAGPFPSAANLLRQERNFMEVTAESVRALTRLEPSFRVSFVPYEDRHGEELAHLLAASYRGHVDSEINDQYRSIPGARHFLTNIIQYPGCGRFAPEASILAIDVGTGRACGMCLASRISETGGHITQLCILPALRNSHLGYELMRQTAVRLADTGSSVIGLTVTCANANAVRLYVSTGFRIVSRFPALVWDGL
jgi:ribosomal protein S18 acetylase RimI-like enzyme